jgi:hypothetical protein
MCLYIYMCVCMYIYMSIYIYICVYIYTLGLVSSLTFKSDRQAVCVWSDSGQKKSDVSDQTRLSAKKSDCLTFCLKSRKFTKISEILKLFSPFLINFRVLLKNLFLSGLTLRLLCLSLV